MKDSIIYKLEKKKTSLVDYDDCGRVLDNSDLTCQILSMFGEDEYYWKNFGELFASCLYTVRYIDGNGPYKKYYYYGAKYLPINTILYHEANIIGIFSEYIFSWPNFAEKENKKRLLDCLCERFNPKTLPSDFIYNEKVLELFLNNKKFDYISNIKNVNGFSYKLAKLLVQKYPFELYGIPGFIQKILNSENSIKIGIGLNRAAYESRIKIDASGLLEIINKIGIENISLSSLIKILGTMNYSYSFSFIEGNSFKRLFIAEILKRLIKNPKEYVTIYRNGYYEVLNYVKENIVSYLVSHDDIYHKLIENHIYLFIDNAVILGITTMDTVFNYIAEHLSDEVIYASLLCILNSSNQYTNYGKAIKNNNKLMNALIEKGNLNILIRYVFPCDITQHVNSEYAPKIIKEIRNGNNLYYRDINNLNSEIINYPAILMGILSTNKIYDFSFLKDVDYRYFDDEQLTSALQKYMINYPGEIIISNNTKLPFIADVLIQRKKYYKLCAWLDNAEKSVIKKLSPYSKASLLEIIKNDETMLDRILLSNNKFEIVLLSREILMYTLENNFISMKYLLNYANHHEDADIFYSTEICLIYKDFIVNNYAIKEENYLYLVNNLGPYILKYLGNENIINLLNMDMNLLMKIGNLFKTDDYSIHDVETIYDSLMQYDFGIYNVNIINAFSNIVNYLEGNYDEWYVPVLMDGYINDISSVLSEDFLVKLSRKYPNLQIGKTASDTLYTIFNKIRDNENSAIYKNILHDITDYYIRKNREGYRKLHSIDEFIEIPFTYDENSIKRFIIKTLLNHDCRVTINDRKDFFSNHLDCYLAQNGFQSGSGSRFLEYYRENKTDLLSQDTYKILSELAGKYINMVYPEITKDDNMRSTVIGWYSSSIKKNYDVIGNREMVYKILGSMDLKSFISGTINDDEVYTSLSRLLQKYKLHLIPEYILKFINYRKSQQRWNDFFLNFGEIADFISYYGGIYRKNTNMTFPKLVETIITVSTNLDYYNQILGREDTHLIKSNPVPNAARTKIDNNKRLKEAVEWTIKNYKRNEITVPAFNKVLTFGKKKMRIIVGNFTHPSNVTHGERTGACMRIGGVGESLFNFVLENKNGFHIRFEDPDTHEYISRVSGFRNGNTVFLNELRYSLNKDKYTEEDIVEFCRLASNEIIELSKTSSLPIENVVIHKDYALLNSNLNIANLGVSNIKEGLPNFYTDVSGNAVCLATSSENSAFAKVMLGVDNLPVYMPAREEVIYSTNYEELREIINRVHAMNILLHSDLPYYKVEPLSLENTFESGYASMDWYAYRDTNGEVHFKNIGLDDRASIELEVAIDNLKNNLKTNIIY